MNHKTCRDILKKLKSKEPAEVREGCFLVGEERCREGIPILVELLKSKNVGIQEAAELSLRKLGGETSVEALIPLLWEEDPSIRNTAIDILREIGDQGLDLIIDLLNEENADIRIFAVDILGCSKNVLVVNILCDVLLNDKDPNVRAQAAVGLGEMRYVEAISCLEKALDDEEWVKFSVIEALKKIGKDSSAEVLINCLGKGSDLIDSAIIDALAHMGKVRIVPTLLNKLESDNPALRSKIIQALVTLLGEKTLVVLSEEQRNKFESYLIEALSDDDEDVQRAAIQGLSYIKGENASKALFEYIINLNEETDEELFDLALDVLKGLGTSKAILDGAKSKDEKTSLFAIRLLSEFDDDKAIEVLCEVFWDQDRDIQREIVDALAKKTNPLLKDFFIDVLKKHKDGKVLKSALKFLGEQLKCEEAQEEIFKFLDHPYDDVKEVALKALVAIGSDWIKEKFLEMHKSEEPIKRFMAVFAFGAWGCFDFRDKVEESLNDECDDIRKLAVEAYALCSQGGADEDEMIEVLKSRVSDPSREVKLALINVLSTLENKYKVKDILIGLMNDPDDLIKIRALDLYPEICSGNEVIDLSGMLKSENKMVKIKTIEALGKIGGDVATKMLLDVLKTEKEPEIQEIIEKIITKDR